VKEAGVGSSSSLFPSPEDFPGLRQSALVGAIHPFKRGFPRTGAASRPLPVGPLPAICPLRAVFPAPGNRPD